MLLVEKAAFIHWTIRRELWFLRECLIASLIPATLCFSLCVHWSFKEVYMDACRGQISCWPVCAVQLKLSLPYWTSILAPFLHFYVTENCEMAKTLYLEEIINGA